MSDLERLMAKVEKWGPHGCWLWSGCKTAGGYGQFRFEGSAKKAHRVAYQLLRGPIPLGMDLDHLCRRRACVNPDHLEPVTRRENLLRGQTLTAAAAAKTHCAQGHPFSGENLHVSPQGYRKCRECWRARLRKRKDYLLAYKRRTRAAQRVADKPA